MSERIEVALKLAVVAVLGDEAGGDAGNRLADGHARVHQRQDAAADAGHRGRAVGFHDLARYADGIREIRLRRDHRLDGTLRERAVADLAPPGGTRATGLAHGEGREVVVKDEALFLFAASVGVEHLGFLERGKRGQRERLGLTAAEERGAVGARQQAHFGLEFANLIDGAAIAAGLAVENRDAERLFLEVLERLGHLERRRFGILRRESRSGLPP